MLFLSKYPLVDEYRMSSVRHVFCGAAPLSEHVARQVSERLGVSVRQGYGMTECSPGILIALPGQHPLSSIGVPMSNTEVKVLFKQKSAKFSEISFLSEKADLFLLSISVGGRGWGSCPKKTTWRTNTK